MASLRLDGTEHLFLVYEKWRRFDVLVFDIFKDGYDWKTAHDKSNLPVILLDHGRARRRISIAAPMVREEVNSGVASHHSLNGWQAHPPYVADYTLPEAPSYDCPRDMIFE